MVVVTGKEAEAAWSGKVADEKEEVFQLRI
jgi:hypothetical protein